MYIILGRDLGTESCEQSERVSTANHDLKKME